MAVVLKQFPWSSNGYDVEILNPGDERDFGSAHAGLAGEGFVSGPSVADEVVEEVVVVEEAPQIEIAPEVTPEPTPVVTPAAQPAKRGRKRN